jgi:hypothetical protein
MASHGKVLDLFDDRYLELQDVVGNVEPLPTLVPYEEYKQNAITYRMDTNHAVFLALLQDFTERKAIETGKELWTWCVQWEVDQEAARQSSVSPHSLKKPRLDLGQPDVPTAQRPRLGTAPITTQTRILDPELMCEEDMLRILVDIVQVSSAVVPNFIEFLYRWIDFYEGDGTALKAALRGEIPSLWDFEHHPLTIPGDIKKKMNQANGESKDKKNEEGNKTPTHSNTEELAQNSPTKKMREKPDLAALERKAEESERLQYREVHFGIQPPKLDEPLPPLINIPRDRQKREKYYAACFKSRQRVFYMLMEAGVTPQHIRDYHRCQEQNVKDTPSIGGDGLRNYKRDAQMAQKVFLEKEERRKKQTEIAISNKLDSEAKVAEISATPEGASGVPLIPATPSYPRRQDMAGEMLRKIQESRRENEQRINIVPKPLVGKMKSQLFEGAKDRQTLLESLKKGPVIPAPRHATIQGEGRGSYTGSSGGESFYGSYDSDDDGDNVSDRMSMSSGPLPPLPSLPRPSLPPLPRPNFPGQIDQSFVGSMGLSTPQQHMSGGVGFPPAVSISDTNPMPQHGVSLPVSGAYPTPATIVSPSQGFNLGPQHPMSGRLGGYNPFIMQPPAGLAHPYSFSSPMSDQRIQPSGLNTAGNVFPYPLRYGPGQPAPPQPLRPFTQHQPYNPQPYIPHQYNAPFHPVAPGLSTPAQPPGFAQRLLAAQQEHDTYPSGQGQPRVPSAHASLQIPVLNNTFMQNMQQRLQTLHPPSPNHFLPSRQPSLQRTAPSPLTLMPPPSPFSSLAPSLLVTSPFTACHSNIPVQIYFPKVVMPANTLGPGGAKLGNGGSTETDAFLLGHVNAGSGEITLSKAVFLPVGVWQNTTERVRKGNYSVLESYPAPAQNMPSCTMSSSHRAVYEKMREVFGFMIGAPLAVRERELTKRWRASKGPMTASGRGAVWEGWAVEIDREIRLSKEERRDAVVLDTLIDGRDVIDSEQERRQREMDALLMEEEEEEDMLEGMDMEE